MSSLDWKLSVAEEKPSERTVTAVEKNPPIDFMQQELFSLLAQHKVWVDSRGAEGRRLELSQADFSGKDLTGVNLCGAILQKANFSKADLLLADLRGASLAQSNFREANLLGADFRGADLQGVCFEGANGVSTRQFAGANLQWSKLSASVAEFEGFGIASEVARATRGLFWGLLILCALGGAVVATTKDVQLLRNSPLLPLASVGAAIPMVGFFFIMPTLLLGMYIYFHLTLQRLSDRLSELPIVFPDGRVLEKAGPWQGIWYARRDSRSGEQNPVPGSFLERAIRKLLHNWVVPATLILFWARYLVMQDLRATLLHILLVIMATAFALFGPSRATKISPDGHPLPLPRHRVPGFQRAIFPLKAASWLGFLLLLISVGTIYGVPHESRQTRDISSADIRRWAPNLLWAFGYAPFPDLTESNISSKPSNWTGEDAEVSRVKGANLNKSRMRYAEAYRSFWVNAHLWEADLQSAYVSESDFRGANLRQANLQSAVLDRALLFRANLQGANLGKANLVRTDLREADLSFAVLSDATLLDAKLDAANLFSANLRGARLSHTGLEKADLREADLSNAEMAQADMREAYLWSTRLPGVRLQDAHLERAILIEADLQNADLRGAAFSGAIVRAANFVEAKLDGADLRGVSGLTAEQICSAQSHRDAELDEALETQVAARCGGKK